MKKTVLLIECHDNLRRLYESLLAVEFQVFTARNNAEAFGWFKKGISPDVIVTEIKNTQSGNASFVRFLKSSGMYSDIPVVVTGKSEKTAILYSGIWHVTNPSKLLPQLQLVTRNKRQPKAAEEHLGQHLSNAAAVA